jgi:hypothetical protein
MLQEKEQREEELRNLANQSRMVRSDGGMATGAATTTNSGGIGNVSDHSEDDDDSGVPPPAASKIKNQPQEKDDDVAANQRERLIQEGELRLENNQETTIGSRT